MERMSAAAFQAYRSLVYETEGFNEFWTLATPLDEIKRLTIGSRPTARQAGGDSVERVRAIPWVFSWMQSRFNLPGWYGLGSGMEACGDYSLLGEMYREWAFFSALIDNAEMSLVKADMDIARLYAELVPDAALRQRIMGTIQGEFERTRSMILKLTGHSELMENEPVVQRSIVLRNPYVDPLNYLQVQLMQRLREGDEEEELLREAMVLTINGIAAGLRNTG
jgi:phosphoenolpyruvate carboxylase